MTQDSLRDLARNARAGDRDAFEQLAESQRERLRNLVRSQLGAKARGIADVDDLVQETQLRAFESLERFVWRGEDSFFRWLATIARHLIWNASQKRSARDIRLRSDPPASATSPSKGLRRQERLERLEDSLAKLRPDERQAIQLARMDGFKIREVAQQMDRPEATVKSLLARGLKKLRESFGDTESLHLPALPVNPDEETDGRR